MKNEDRIVELLAESLKKQDQMIERMDKSEKQQKEYNERVVASVDALSDIVKVWMERTKKIDDFEERIRRLEKHIGLE